ncbi:hypothetical protein BU26DRAFT_560689 [Trematosphaeria pertusa]|uniref:Uncharacterized protein n=1 Tax=Trematosphaeria pertusa TaxID=390896 RepID=A0A6A6ISB6_9PLEO|nr:uncharacterized protein BU26DRAFT_560689 [Trematosphaeria pertusa]KAF2253381.1 hypothetical protein BU26DRAFT_560689 [Trematosphaeria pertusa]
MSQGSMKWEYNPQLPRKPSHGEISYLGVLRNYDIGGIGGNLTASAANLYSDELAIAIQRRPADPEFTSDTQFISCWLWNVSGPLTVTAMNGVGRIEIVNQSGRAYVPVEVTSTSYFTVFDCHARNLNIPYGLIILFNALFVCLGVYCFHRKKGSIMTSESRA